MKGLTHAREPMPVWPPFKLAEYGSEHPEPRWASAYAVYSQSYRCSAQCRECMFHPRLANLFEALGVIGAAAHPIQILWYDWMIGLW